LSAIAVVSSRQNESRVNDLVKIASLGIEAFWSAPFENFRFMQTETRLYARSFALRRDGARFVKRPTFFML